jgi:hypothetical protein
LHNRDWPTIWAASVLGEYTAHGPVEYDHFKVELVNAAWKMASALSEHWDISGLPNNRSKALASEARFIEFFVGSQIGSGPLFSFGLAGAADSSSVALTESGAALLRRLSGLTREKGVVVSSSHRMAFLRHLARFAPADLNAMQEVVLHISAGESTRLELIAAIERAHPDWPGGTAATNAAGYVARAREWGILSEKQVNHQYVIAEDGAAELGSVLASSAEAVKAS